MITDTDIQKLKQVFVTKEDLKHFATKKDLERFATKDDITDIKKELSNYATKDDLKETTSILVHQMTMVIEVVGKLSDKIDDISIKLDKTDAKAEQALKSIYRIKNI